MRKASEFIGFGVNQIGKKTKKQRDKETKRQRDKETKKQRDYSR
jgi:hypothetical protein